ncbi:MAG: GlsB/YeaQ/YmgE family stress response membrane protein [Pararhodobacter sp.]|nr:GlsB/YeaQ/YmgE family stress response membrane protein [Pararhodobacter sp.]
MAAGILTLVIIGAAAGYLATRLMRVDVDLPSAMGLGVLGALIGGLGLRLLLTVGNWALTFVLALLGSMALIWLWQAFRRRR